MTPRILPHFLHHFQTRWPVTFLLEGEPRSICVPNAYHYSVLQVGAAITPHAEEEASYTPNHLMSLKPPFLPPTVCLWGRTLYWVASSLRTSYFTSMASVSPCVGWWPLLMSGSLCSLLLLEAHEAVLIPWCSIVDNHKHCVLKWF